MKSALLDQYVCAVPFISLEIHDKSRFLCCASWLKEYLPQNSTPEEAWNSVTADNIRASVLDGTFKYCDKTQCPFLHQLLTFGETGRLIPLYRKDSLPSRIKSQIEDFHLGRLRPKTIQFSFDRTCNLQCPSCRISVYTANKAKILEVEDTIDKIQKTLGESIETIYITGSGDPFVSVGFKRFLREFDKRKWPSLKKIHLHTNATKWNRQMWASMKNIHPYVKSCEISIDAATKNTYENKVRIGGNWDELISNLKFISSINSLREIKASFVVQKSNYKEMKLFYDLMLGIFGSKVNVFFGKITNWGTYSENDFKLHKIWDSEHPEFNDFVKELNITLPANQGWTNLQEFIIPHRAII